MKKLILIIVLAVGLSACGKLKEDTDKSLAKRQEVLMAEADAQTGLPSIKNFREKKILKTILEMRDQENLRTYTYTIAEQTGRLVFVGESIGFAIPAATQYTSPQKDIYYSTSSAPHLAMPQADPNGLFSPSSAEGSWVLMVDPDGGKPRPVYFEPRIVVSPFKLKNSVY